MGSHLGSGSGKFFLKSTLLLGCPIKCNEFYLIETLNDNIHSSMLWQISEHLERSLQSLSTEWKQLSPPLEAAEEPLWRGIRSTAVTVSAPRNNKGTTHISSFYREKHESSPITKKRQKCLFQIGSSARQHKSQFETKEWQS